MGLKNLARSVLLVLMSKAALAYGPQGHQYVGAIADELLSASARKNVAEILGVPLRVASTWADCAKDVSWADGKPSYRPDPRYHEGCKRFESPQGIAELEDFVGRNRDNCRRGKPQSDVCHKQYHYTDVAIQHGRYDRAYAGTSEQDVVAAVTAAIAVLQGKRAPAPFKIRDKREALLLLAHLVGDLYQPLHVGAVYLDRQGQLVNPDDQRRLDPATNTRGGNSIRVGSKNMHADWDAVPKWIDPLSLDKASLERARNVAVVGGSPESWPAQWASETVVASQEAFKGVQFSYAAGTKPKWVAHFDDRKTYVQTKQRIQAEQLEKAGARLAQILNAIWQ
ncbi:hypothetical protein AYO46_08360 [Betaproteobacteria bacterium SCGC AG-212-J23]|nr:hypothetical protein AYO46_08360 [Betaproteobacteria bacterium SCGC AG-212-J23]